MIAVGSLPAQTAIEIEDIKDSMKKLWSALLILAAILTTAQGLEPPLASKQKALIAQAEAGNMEAQHNLAVLYWYNGHSQGVPGPPDSEAFQNAFKWATLASNGGYAPAHTLLANLLRDGFGTDKDIAKACLLYEKAALAGQLVAAMRLAHLYTSGQAEGGRNVIKSYAWFSLCQSDRNLKNEATENLRQLASIMSENEVKAAKNLARKLQNDRKRHARTN